MLRQLCGILNYLNRDSGVGRYCNLFVSIHNFKVLIALYNMQREFNECLMVLKLYSSNNVVHTDIFDV